MFCGCKNDPFHAPNPNIYTCPVCLGLPGALLVPNIKAVEWAMMMGIALNCSINEVSKFDRKHYFYPDLPKGFQISQYDEPLCRGGQLALDSGKIINLTRVHLEEDTGKLIHQTVGGKRVSLVDFNRSGVPLVEIVTEPDIASGAEAKEFLKKLTAILRTLKVSDCDMEKGSMRLEANVSMGESLAYKVEVKNLNSFRFVEQAIDYELSRQEKLLKAGKTPRQETRGYDPKTRSTFVQRYKETAEDYRYFPEPDIPPMVFSDKDIAAIRAKLPRLPEAKAKDLVDRFNLPPKLASLLVAKASRLTYFKNSVKTAQTLKVSPEKLANLIINHKISLDKPAAEQLKTLTQKQTVDLGIIDQVIKDNPDVVAKIKAGKSSAVAFLVGQVMRLTRGQADAVAARKLLLKRLQV
ncbi:TPA: Asp-tRNA(Asn)/Glu-tRNA(Gln) amidotransferase GatCAB subunit B [Candidatus Beckwithbacteria bacterium]|nr:Asp-tRNA(Asn)/Glu-tRNA(Gln) amidotransferase GatCAB subunit B [Candidatus Beckwithbacteria bacterium]